MSRPFAGLSGSKAAAIVPDDEVVARLSKVRGVGRWTAEMHLGFDTWRPDIWPVGVREDQIALRPVRADSELAFVCASP